MKFKDKRDGSILEPASEAVARMMMGNPNFERVEEKPAAKKTAPKRVARPKQ